LKEKADMNCTVVGMESERFSVSGSQCSTLLGKSANYCINARAAELRKWALLRCSRHKEIPLLSLKKQQKQYNTALTNVTYNSLIKIFLQKKQNGNQSLGLPVAGSMFLSFDS
jgi:hypothetical protein